ncbi:MAG TPA: Phenylacetic acid catabolic protein [Ktedonobacterales bacterium]|nr:Phenylacetic acid catabolic protein [Ktedonobacterales bacterium]
MSEALFGLVARLADNKYVLGRRYAEWCSSAPTLEASVAAAAMAQDELGHARALYPLLRTLAPAAGVAVGPEIEPETRTQFMTLTALAEPFGGWPDFVAANLLIDSALTQIFVAAQSSSFEPLAGRSRKVLQEERAHVVFGAGWAKRLAGEGGAVKAATKGALRRMWDETLCWFGSAGLDAQSDPLANSGALDATPDELRARWLAAVGPTLEAAGLALPVRHDAKTGAWELTAALPWDRWDASAYRLPALAPVKEAAR